ncbi:CocE/NonD family hydrolase [uncultured Bacteroides sp.]|uniref:CocE/NonD family hydrolase n=1 Tax=uncultured Bacteroides sp. TaxID=162156 RepID=UPI002AAB4CF1|nr:CocE/NonD family hydrolase [uncultured Bacteroides sp.]
MKRTYLLIVFISFFAISYSQVIDEKWVKENYTKREVMIPMRDGTKLFTAIYEPVSKSEKHPVLMFRTPYGTQPYGKEPSSQMWYSWPEYAKEGYIIVYQDVRGKWMSEGKFVNVRPFNPNKKKKTDIDEASDTYDTVEWLLKNTVDNNGNVGVSGCSYLGFYSLMAALSNHPAIKAICPQAPVTDWFMGDDIHHNGALMLSDAFNFISYIDRPRAIPTAKEQPSKSYYDTDEYSFFLKSGAIKNLTKMLGDSIKFWNDVTEHPDYDSWWKDRNTRTKCFNIKPAVLMVGGLFDAEDAYGTWGLYKAINKQSPDTKLNLAIGPWNHGGWIFGNGTFLGNIRFGSNTSEYYQKELEFPFFNYYLKGKGNPDGLKKAKIFFSGENKWKEFESWPPKETVITPLYLADKGTLQFTTPDAINSYTEYTSDPSKPVPYAERIQHNRGIEYMTDDQRFAESRPDVISFKTEPLTTDLTLGGELIADLKVIISTTDADFVVKLIDVFPDDFYYDKKIYGEGNGQNYLMNGYEMLVRGDVMRGRYRNSFEKPETFVPNKPTTVSFKLTDIAHTFKKGHRVMIQIQSSWFPLVDRNPQQFVDIYHCNDSDFIKSNIRILHQQDEASRILLPVLK